jgi:ligand-binding sensor domain-containing protein
MPTTSPPPCLSSRQWFLLAALGLALFPACSQSSLSDPSLRATQSPPSGASRQFLQPISGIRGIFEDSQGKLYFTSTEWNATFDPSARDSASGGFTYFTQDLDGVMVSGFQEDAQGRIWAQGSDGIYRFDDGKFTPIPHRDFDHKDQWAMTDGDLWFGVDGSVGLTEQESVWGVYRLRDGAATFLAFPEPPPGERAKFYPLTSRPMMGNDGTLWFGTFNAAFGFNGESWEILGRERLGMTRDPRHIGLRGYHLDSRGYLWMADNGAGVFVYDGADVHHFTALHDLEDADVNGPSLHRAFSIAEDTDGTMWFGSVYSGLWRYAPSEQDPIGKGTFTNYGKDEGWPCENAWTIYRTRSGELLFAGEDPGGVYRFDGQRFERVY